MKNTRPYIIYVAAAGCSFLCGCMAEQMLVHKAGKIHKNVLTIDSHTDTPMRFSRSKYDIGKKNDPYSGGGKVDFPRMAEGGMDAVFFAAFIDQQKRDYEGNEKAKKKTIEIIAEIKLQVSRYSDMAEIAYTPEDAYRIEKQKKRAIYIGIENGYAIGNDLSMIKTYFDMGARYITLCHTSNNDICDSSTDLPDNIGLSDFGIKVVREMNRLGMLIDVSHMDDESFFEVLQYTKTPVIASHSCAREICEHPRNFSDSMLQTLKKNGGVIQLCILSAYVKLPQPNPQRDSAEKALRNKYSDFASLSDSLKEQAYKEWYNLDKTMPRELATVSDAVDHIDHIVKTIGIDYVGIGTDFDGGGGLKDWYDVTGMKNITLELVKRGYTKEDIEKIWGGNFMRVFRKNLEYGKIMQIK